MEHTVALIDMGSNSLRLMKSTWKDSQWIHGTKQLATTRLGKGVGETGLLSEESQRASLEVLEAWQKELGNMPVKIVATSAVREAKNGPDFVKEVEDALSWKVQIWSGEEEARYGYIGALGQAKEGTVLDIGGGSTEIAIGKDGIVTWSHSYDIGAVRMAVGAPVTKKEVDQLQRRWNTIFAATPIPPICEPLVGIGGTITSAGAIMQGLTIYDKEKIQGYTLSLENIQYLIQWLGSLSAKEKETVPGLQIGRAPVIVSGLLILEDIMKRTKATALSISERDGMEGFLQGKTFHSFVD